MSEQVPDTTPETSPKRSKFFGKQSVLALIFLGITVFGLSQGYGIKWTGSLLSENSETNVKQTGKVLVGSSSSIHVPQVEAEPFVSTEKVLGSWLLDGAIRREIENRNDGTATITVTFDFITALRYGSKLQLDLEWTLKDDVLTHKIVGGSPEQGKKRLISDFGEKSYFKILNISEEEMHLVDFDTPPEKYLWKRIPGESVMKPGSTE